MIYYIDFDRTIFNTKLFLEDLCDILEEYHIPKDKFIEKTSETEEFNPFKILRLMKDEYPYNSSLLVDIERLLKSSSVYLYYDALKFLRDLKKNNNQIILLTKGDEDFQNCKIDNCGIRKIFDKVIITHEDKGNLDINYQGIFIDDKKEEIESILKRKPYKVYLIDRDNKDNLINDSNINTIHSLSEIIIN